MKPLLSAAVLAFAALALGSSASHACGDKFLVQGRGQSYGRMHMSSHPAAILIYQNSSSKGVAAVDKAKYEDALREAGHRVAVCGASLDCDLAVTAGGYDIVMADIADAPKLAEKLKSESSRTVVVPVAYRATKSEVEQAKTEFGFVYDAPSSPGKLLTIVDDVMKEHNRVASTQ